MLRNLTQLEAYYWACQLGSFRGAAAKLGVTQPAVSARIAELERSLGVVLFERVGRAVRPTDEGGTILEYAERLIMLTRDLERRAGGHRPLRGVLRFGVPDSFALLCLGGFLKALEVRQPELSIAVTVDNSRILAKKLEEASVHAAILVQPQSVKDFRVQPLGPQPLTWVASPNLRLPDRVLEPDDLINHQILTNPAPSITFSVLMDWFGQVGLTPRHLSTCNSVAVISSVVAAGAGISVLPICIAEGDIKRGQLVPLRTRPGLPAQQMFVAYLKTSSNRAIDDVVDVVRQVIAGTGFVDPPA